jgi:hypothetical protein
MKGGIMENNDIIVDKSFVKTVGKTIVKSVAVAAGVTVGVVIARKAFGTSTPETV